MSVPAYLLVPHARRNSAPGPAVLAVHGHGPGKARVCGVEPGGAGDDYAHVLASLGYVVLAPDLRGFGERSEWMPEGIYHCDWDLVCATMAGVVPLERNLWDLARARPSVRACARRSHAGRGRRAVVRCDLHAPAHRARRSGTRCDCLRVSVVVARRAHGALEHVRFPGHARATRCDRTPRHRRAHRAAAAAGRVGNARLDLPGRVGARHRRPSARGVRALGRTRRCLGARRVRR